jgi:hypothetical protein
MNCEQLVEALVDFKNYLTSQKVSAQDRFGLQNLDSDDVELKLILPIFKNPKSRKVLAKKLEEKDLDLMHFSIYALTWQKDVSFGLKHTIENEFPHVFQIENARSRLGYLLLFEPEDEHLIQTFTKSKRHHLYKTKQELVKMKESIGFNSFANDRIGRLYDHGKFFVAFH